jgi:hypothetical protein
MGSTNSIEYIRINTTGNAKDFGDLISAANSGASLSSATRGVFGGAFSSGATNVIQYVTISTTGNSTDFGDLTIARYSARGASNATRGLFGAGETNSGYSNTIDYITIASTGNATDFGDTLSTGGGGGTCSSTRACFAGGQFGGGASDNLDVISYVTISTTGNATDFGDLTQQRRGITSGIVSSGTKGVFGCGYNNGFVLNTDYITIASTGNATSFGDITGGLGVSGTPGCCSSTIRGVYAGSGSNNTITYMTIDTNGSWSDFGDLLTAGGSGSGLSNSHGGL